MTRRLSSSGRDGIGAGAVQHDEIVAPKDLNGVMDLVHRAHARGQQDGAPEGAVVAKQIVVRQARPRGS